MKFLIEIELKDYDVLDMYTMLKRILPVSTKDLLTLKVSELKEKEIETDKGYLGGLKNE